MSFTKEYARARVAAVTELPQLDTILKPLIPTESNFFFKSFLFRNVLVFYLFNSLNGKDLEFSIDPLLTSGRGSGSKPKIDFCF